MMTLAETVRYVKGMDRVYNEPFLYHPIEHPDLAGMEAQQPCVDRWEMISRVLPEAERDVLRYDLPGGGRKRLAVDFGCHTGWFSRQLARLGWSVIGIDRSPEWLAIARSCNELLRGPNVPEFWNMDLLTLDEIPVADVGLFLSIAMYTFEDVEAGWRLLERISRRVDLLFFDFGGQYAARVPFTKDDAIDEVTSRTLYRHGTLLGESDNGRPMFLFER